MMCKLCRSYPCHSLCPNYMPPHSEKKCIICGEYINVGEEYVENYEGEVAHFNCLSCDKQDLKWLGEDIQIMQGGD